jgi:pimeloyl-ACP methyl ester carboxylesterase
MFNSRRDATDLSTTLEVFYSGIMECSFVKFSELRLIGIAQLAEMLIQRVVNPVISGPIAAEQAPSPRAPLSQGQDWVWQGHRIRYVCVGVGEPMLLLHGFGASIGHWQKNIAAFAAAGYQVYALDLLGFGASDKPSIAYTMELWQSLVYDFWQDLIQRPTVIIGNSIGGLLTLMLLANHPPIATHGILLNPAGGLNHRPDELNPLLGGILATFAKLANSDWLGPWLFDRVRQKARIRSSLKQIYRNPAAITDELVEMLYRPSCDPGAQKVFAAILSAPPGPKPSELLPQVQVPLLVLWGEDDPWTPIQASQLYATHHGEQPIQVAVLPRTGHCPHDERPELVNPCVLDWLRQQVAHRSISN